MFHVEQLTEVVSPTPQKATGFVRKELLL